MKKLISLLLCLTMSFALLSACSSHTESNIDLMKSIHANPLHPKSVSLSGTATSAPIDFAVRLFQASETKGTNTLISPISVLCAIAMTANGADGDTLTQMEETLGMNVSELNSYLYDYLNSLPKSEKYKLDIANSIWFRDAEYLSVNTDFLQTNADFYNAEIYKSAFDRSTLNSINNWVEDKTDGMIKNILDDISEDAIMYLINALSFDAEWQNIYKSNQIRNGIFTTEDGTELEAELMYSKENLYLNDGKAEGFIKYYADSKYAIAALLPNEGISISEYVSSLTGDSLAALLAEPQHTSVNTAIPKFKNESNLEMNEILKSMGMMDAFDQSKADFSRIGTASDLNIFIDRVIHKTYISVDESGTKAGAATVVEIKDASALSPEDTKEVILDRPFVYMLIDCESKLPLFIGTMMEL